MMAACGENPQPDPSSATVREIRPSDVPALLSILSESPAASSWPEEPCFWSRRSSGVAWVAEQEGNVIGFLIGRCAADECEVLNLAVARCHIAGVA